MFDARQDAAWSFETARFFIGFYAEPEEMDPAESFEFQDDIDAVRNGDVEWFSAAVRVFLKGENGEPELLVGSDYLGGCAYHTVREFYSGHRHPDPESRNTLANKAKGIVICHYFPSMLAAAVSEARTALRHMPRIRSTLNA